MKVLFYINGIGGGGAERAMANLANGLSAMGHEIILVTSFPREQEYALSGNIKRYNLESAPTVQRQLIHKNIRRIRKLRKICKDEDCDVAVSFMEGPNFRLIFSTLFLKIKTIVSERSDPRQNYSNFFHRKLVNFVYSFANACVFQTEEAKAFFDKKIKKKGYIIFNPVAEEFYREEQSKETEGIVGVGRLEISKNFELLISAFSKINKQYPKEKLLIYGEGKHRSELEQMIDRLHLSDQAMLLGRVDNISKKIKNAKIFVLSSDYEGMPNALMEAMALGIAPISTDCPCGGPNLLLGQGEFGILIEKGNEKQLADALLYLLKNEEIRKDYSKKAKERAKNFKVDIICDEWQKLFGRLVKEEIDKI